MPYKDRTKYLTSQKRYYKENPEVYKWRTRLGKVGLTKEQFFEFIEVQNNSCALCNKAFESLWGNDCHIDHCHETGRVRGILCMKCNVGLGMLGDNEEGLLKALTYIKGEVS